MGENLAFLVPMRYEISICKFLQMSESCVKIKALASSIWL